MNKPSNYGYPRLFRGIHNSIIDIWVDYCIHDMSIGYPSLNCGYPYLVMNIYNSRQLWIPMTVAAAADGSQDLTRRLTWGVLSAKLNETTTLRPHISRTKRTDNMKFSTRIQKNILSQHAKSWYSRENIVLLSVVLTWHLGTCILAKKRMPN